MSILYTFKDPLPRVKMNCESGNFGSSNSGIKSLITYYRSMIHLRQTNKVNKY